MTLKHILLIAWLLPLSVLSQSPGTAAEKRWHIDEVLADKNTMPLAKDIYQGRWELSNDNFGPLLLILDSFPKMAPAVRGFYFIVIAKSFDKADGAYSEGLGYSGKDFVDNNFMEFLDFFCGEGKLPDVYLQKWAGIVALETELVRENQDAKIVSKISKIYGAKCKDCRSEQRAVSKRFEDLLKTYIK